MSWRVHIPPTERARFAGAVDQHVERAASAASDEQTRQALTVAATALKRLIAAWPVARPPGVTPDRIFAATLSGHANPNGDASTGSPNDRITIDLWRAG